MVWDSNVRDLIYEMVIITFQIKLTLIYIYMLNIYIQKEYINKEVTVTV